MLHSRFEASLGQWNLVSKGGGEGMKREGMKEGEEMEKGRKERRKGRREEKAPKEGKQRERRKNPKTYSSNKMWL